MDERAKLSRKALAESEANRAEMDHYLAMKTLQRLVMIAVSIFLGLTSINLCQPHLPETTQAVGALSFLGSSAWLFFLASSTASALKARLEQSHEHEEG